MKREIVDLIKNGKFYLSQCRSKEELYDFLAEELMKEGLVKESFKKALAEREKQFPTGILIHPYNIAMPHVDSEHVNINGMVVCHMEKPILFHRMDSIQEEIPVTMVFLLLIKSVKLHMPAIVSLTTIWKDTALMNDLLKVKNKEDLINLFNE